jgi:hypothetical protein
MIAGSSSNNGDATRRGSKTMLSRASLDESNSSIYSNALETSAWSALWDLSNTSYPINDSYCEKVIILIVYFKANKIFWVGFNGLQHNGNIRIDCGGMRLAQSTTEQVSNSVV